jgi:hypothetical protein
LTFSPLSSKRDPIDEDANPFPNEETTPPVTKIYFVLTFIKKPLFFYQHEATGLKNLSINSNPFSIQIPDRPAETSSKVLPCPEIGLSSLE